MPRRKVTAGKFQVESDYSSVGYSSIVVAGQTQMVADCRSDSLPPEEVEANARLFSAAKRMQEALKRFPKRNWDSAVLVGRWWERYGQPAMLAATTKPKKPE